MKENFSLYYCKCSSPRTYNVFPFIYYIYLLWFLSSTICHFSVQILWLVKCVAQHFVFFGVIVRYYILNITSWASLSCTERWLLFVCWYCTPWPHCTHFLILRVDVCICRFLWDFLCRWLCHNRWFCFFLFDLYLYYFCSLAGLL